MLDSQLDTLLRHIVQLQLLSVGINAIALVGMSAGLLIMLHYLRRNVQEMRESLTHLAQMTAHIADMTAQVLRDVRGE